MRFVLPHHRALRPRWLLRIGLFLYDHLGGKLLPGSRGLDLTADGLDVRLFQRNYPRRVRSNVRHEVLYVHVDGAQSWGALDVDLGTTSTDINERRLAPRFNEFYEKIWRGIGQSADVA